MKLNRETETICTILGDLVAAVTISAFQVSGNPQEAYVLSAVVVDEILKRNRLRPNCLTELVGVLHPPARAGPFTFERGRGRTKVDFN